MRTVSGSKSRRAGTKAPPFGVYSGTIDGCPAVIRVNADGVLAMWFRPSPRGTCEPHQAAWDVDDGRFQAMSNYGPLRCTVALSSRREVGA